MKFYIKNMVSLRCKRVVKDTLKSMGLNPLSIELGEAEITGELTVGKYSELKTLLSQAGLELMDDKKSILIEKIKGIIIELVHYSDEFPKIKMSEYLSVKTGYNYAYLAALFSEVKGITIQQFILAHKIERAKELLFYNELTLKEIAWKLHYSSPQHLSKQFKDWTGLTPTFFKGMKNKRRKSLDNI